MSDFWRGIWTYIALESLTQDFIGKEAYLQHASEHWADACITVPVALFILGVVIVWRKGEQDHDDSTIDR